MPPYICTKGRRYNPTTKQEMVQTLNGLVAELQDRPFLLGLTNSAVAGALNHIQAMGSENMNVVSLKAKIRQLQELAGHLKHESRPRSAKAKADAATYLEEHCGGNPKALVEKFKMHDLVQMVDEHWMEQCCLATQLSQRLQSILDEANDSRLDESEWELVVEKQAPVRIGVWNCRCARRRSSRK